MEHSSRLALVRSKSSHRRQSTDVPFGRPSSVSVRCALVLLLKSVRSYAHQLLFALERWATGDPADIHAGYVRDHAPGRPAGVLVIRCVTESLRATPIGVCKECSESIAVRHGNSINAPAYFDRIAYRLGVKVSLPELSLPVACRVVRLRMLHARNFRRERSRAVPREVGSYDTDAFTVNADLLK